MAIRIGTGYDVHRLVTERKLILCGVEIPHSHGLLGHSDADVAAHAAMDAILGAAACPDIGRQFPDSDPNYEGADSLMLMRRVNDIIAQKGFGVSNIDITVIAQAPKLAPYIEAMRRNIADALSIDVDCVNVKATTEEGLGFTGERLGIAAQAVCIIESK